MVVVAPDTHPALTARDADGRPALVHEDEVWNLALGSNMDIEKLRSRHPPTRKPIEPLVARVPATAPGWALAFDLLAMPPAEPAMAGAVRVRDANTTTSQVNGLQVSGASVDTLHGILYKLSREDYLTLSMSEGCCARDGVANRGSNYEEVVVEAFPYPSHQLVHSGKVPTKVFATVFALRKPPPTALITMYIYPSRRYLDLLIKGSKAASLDEQYIAYLENHPAARPVGDGMRAVSRFVFIAYWPLLAKRRLRTVLNVGFKSVVFAIFSQRERAFFAGRLYLESFWHILLVIYMMPLAILGFLRAAAMRRPVFRIVRGLSEQ